ncbi:MAG: 4-hydroxy-3-methylbut-2-enyl diphosphate reductase [Bacteroidia bacterium]|nr:4-hydroxy-3-methylbut-2-enyl diphosphate reductase [Bacteroidia bacterium]MDW8157974.1 4-hydroxy-3-methylbut-2-enyl diphosphate reductase [Bacteroidia bacterium]
MQVVIDRNSGFCFGVVYAIEMAERFLEENGSLYCLGDIVHNDEEVNRLKAKGLKIIDHNEFKNLRDTTVLIRAHGEPPETYRIALQNNIQLIDASCPVVLKLQNRVRSAYEQNTQVVIYGKIGHAEVNGLVGQTQGQAIVISGIEDLDKLDYSRPIALFSQTTKSTSQFYAIKAEIEKRTAAFKANDTICRQVSNREPQLAAFATQHEVIIFVAGKKSSNGRVLYNVCKEANPNSYFISEPNEIDPTWLKGKDSVGICGATSTPMWLMEKVKEYVLQLCK